MRGADSRRVTGGKARWCGHTMDAARVVITSVVPACRSPIGDEAERREGGNGENGCSGGGVSIHRASVRIAENGESCRIVTGIRPRHAGTNRARDGVGGVSRGWVCAGAACYSHPCHCCYGYRRGCFFHGHIGVDQVYREEGEHIVLIPLHPMVRLFSAFFNDLFYQINILTTDFLRRTGQTH